MKTLGLLITTALVLPLGACVRHDRCDSNGWCDDTTAVQVCFYDHDCAPDARCQGGSCVPRLPVPPPRGTGGTGGSVGAGGSYGAGGSRSADAGGFDTGSAGGSHHADGGITGAGGEVSVDAGIGSTGGSGAGGSATGGSGAGGSGTGGANQPPADAGAPHVCTTDGGGGAGSCHPQPTPVCQFDHDCGLTGRCVDGECQTGCTATTDCGTGQVCTQGYCVTPTTSGGQCVFNADCGTGETCINGYCHADCATSADCLSHGQGQDVCTAGICQPDTGPHPQCRASADCVGVHVTEDVCVDAVCRTPCLSDTDCCVGSSGSICQMGYCVTANEVAPQCHISSDCGAATQTCIDATCE